MTLPNINTLNPAQYAATIHTEGPTLIIAGPGSGKTRVLTYRVAHLIREKRVPPYTIMVLTFTKKAAEEMKKRIEYLLGESVQGYWIGTFHSLFARILRIEASAIGFDNHFSIYDTDDSKALIKRIIKEYNLDENHYKLGVVYQRIHQAKRSLIDPTQYAEQNEWQDEDIARNISRFDQIYLAYQQRCRLANAMDYDDLIVYTYKLFQEHPTILAKYQERFQYLLVDEFQDTDQLQYTILKALAHQHANLCVIGDDAQSIYSFRGADIRNILFFKRYYPTATVFKLQENFRSTEYIVNNANALIQNNEQHPKKLFTKQGKGNPVRIIKMLNELEEATFVAHSIRRVHSQQHVDYDKIAILYRNNSQSRALEEALMRKNIPYQVLGSISFYQRKEIKDIIAYLYLIINPTNEEALIRAISQPKRSIGRATLDKIRMHATAHHMTLWKALTTIKDWMKGKIAERINDFAQLIIEHQAMQQDSDAHTITTSIIKKSGLWYLLRSDTTPEGRTRYDNAKEFVESIRTFVEKNKQAATLAHFLEEIALITTVDQEETALPKVKLLTMHKAKGLEFPHVYIVGMEENICPSLIAITKRQNLSEDRRLFFVGITRAKQELTITYAENRFLYGKAITSRPSRFLQELDPSSIQLLERVPTSSRFGSHPYPKVV